LFLGSIPIYWDVWPGDILHNYFSDIIKNTVCVSHGILVFYFLSKVQSIGNFV